MPIEEIDKEVLKLILHASKSSHPNEFAGILRSEGKKITEVMLLPGTYESEHSVLMKLNMLPVSSKACGSVHSHTSPKPNPSSADLNFFGKIGEVHIITAKPYNEHSWKAYDSNGQELKLDIVESERRKPKAKDFHEDFPA